MGFINRLRESLGWQFQTQDEKPASANDQGTVVNDDGATLTVPDIYSDFDRVYNIQPDSVNELLKLAPSNITTYNNEKRYELYDLILDRDDRIGYLIEQRKASVLNTEWEISYNKQDKTSAIAGDFITDVIYNTIGEVKWYFVIQKLLDAIPKCFSLAEVLYENNGSNLVPTDFNCWNQNLFQWKLDGTLWLVQEKGVELIEGTELEQDGLKYLIHRRRPTIENPYG